MLALKAGQDRLSGTERVSLKGEAWTLSELVRLFSGQLAAKSETCVARLLHSLPLPHNYFGLFAGLYRPGDAAGPRGCRRGRVPRLLVLHAAVHAATL